MDDRNENGADTTSAPDTDVAAEMVEVSPPRSANVVPVDTMDQFFEAFAGFKKDTVHVEGRDKRVYAFRVREMSVDEKARFEASLDGGDSEDRKEALLLGRLRVVQMCVLDSDDNRLFRGKSVAEKIKALGASVITALSNRILTMSGFTDEDVKRAEGKSKATDFDLD